MKCSITLHGILEDFARNLSPKTRSLVIREVLYWALSDSNRDRLFNVLRKFETQDKVEKIISLLPEPSSMPNFSAHKPIDEAKKQTLRANQKPKIAQSQEKPQVETTHIKAESTYSEEGIASLEEIRNEFDMTK
ncbi:hypothetical protein [Helicobacter cinaedi]|uniref:hypothetical protein n=1 Tax=Helicobacter cinaedi TaxID=213 RepID=UPI000D7BA100|nr:hypothetical protein [Helicobacter cinaedi]